jgi:hypothetical protein
MLYMFRGKNGFAYDLYLWSFDVESIMGFPCNCIYSQENLAFVIGLSSTVVGALRSKGRWNCSVEM